MVWVRNAFFVGVCGSFLAGLSGYVIPGRPVETTQAPVLQNDDIRQVVAQVNSQFRDHWRALSLSPAPPADDLVIARRLSLALTGTIPSFEEIRALQTQPESSRIDWWLAHLLEDRRFADYVAERLARAYVGTEEGPFLVYRRRRFVSWLSDRLHENQPYDQLVRDLISDTGLWTDSPAVNFITVTTDQNGDGQPDEVRLAGRTARAFLGIRLDCVQCHDDNMGGNWMQSDFHRLAAFFSEARSSLAGIQDAPCDYHCQFLGQDEPQVVTANVPFAQQLLDARGPRRHQLAQWVTHPENSAFSRAIVNRIWGLMLGRPLVQPIDSIPLAGPYPPGLEALAGDFAQHGHDLRRLIRVIASTDVFCQESQARHPITRQHDDHWAAFPLGRLRPEQVAGALIQAARLRTIDASSHILVRLARADQSREFIQRYGDMGEDEFTSDGGTIPQRLLMLNGDLVKERTEDNLLLNAATRIAVFAPSDQRAVEAAYLAVFTRRPTTEEAEHFTSILAGSVGPQRIDHLEDLYWTLLNSTEFSWNH